LSTDQPTRAGNSRRLTVLSRAERLALYGLPDFDAFQRTEYFAFTSPERARVGLSEPGFVQAPSGLAYALVFIGRSGEPFPAGIEVYAIVPALEPLDDEVIDRDLWAILGWMIDGVGPPWTVEGL